MTSRKFHCVRLGSTLLVSLFLTAAAHAQGDATVFEGRYTRTHDRLGLCDPTMLVLTTQGEKGNDDLILSRWRFIRIGGGRVEFDNDIEKGYVESFMNGSNEIVRHWRQYDKIKHANNREDTVATISGAGVLHIRSDTSGVFNFSTDCTYKRIGGVNDYPDDGTVVRGPISDQP